MVKKRRVRHQPMKPEIQGPERRPGLDQIVAGTQPESCGRELFIPVGNYRGWQVNLAGCELLKNCERVDAGVIVLDEQDVRRSLTRIECSILTRQCLDNLDGGAGPSETLSRQRGVADVDQT